MAGETLRRDRLHRGAAGAGRLRQGAGLPVPPLPGRRSGARAGDEVDRRGDGDRLERSAAPSPRPGSAPATSCRSRAPPSSRCTTATRRPWCRWRGASPSSASASSRPPAPPPSWTPTASPCGRSSRSTKARPHVVDHLINGEIDLVVNTPLGSDVARGRRLHPPHRRSSYDIPCITTLSGAMAAAEAIAALRDRKLGVRSLQEIQRLARQEAGVS